MKSTGSDWSYAAAASGITDTSDVAIKAAVAGQRNFLTSLQVKNTHATVATEVVVKDGSTVIWRGRCPAVMLTGDNINFQPPLAGSTNTALNVACITTGAAVYVSAQGYVSP